MTLSTRLDRLVLDNNHRPDRLHASYTVVLVKMQPTAAGTETVKEQVVDKVPKRIKELKFGILYDYRLHSSQIMTVDY